MDRSASDERRAQRMAEIEELGFSNKSQALQEEGQQLRSGTKEEP